MLPFNYRIEFQEPQLVFELSLVSGLTPLTTSSSFQEVRQTGDSISPGILANLSSGGLDPAFGWEWDIINPLRASLRVLFLKYHP